MRTTTSASVSVFHRWTNVASLILAAVVGVASTATPVAGGIRPRTDAVVRVSAGGERIASIRTSRGVTTMISLPAEAKEAICGDLFDAQTGNGCFVIQRSGRDLFLKPVQPTGETNLFVKTDTATYAFDLVVVPPNRAMRIVFVDTAAPERSLAGARDQLDRERKALADERAQFASDRVAATAALDRMRAEIGEEARARAEAIARGWIADGRLRALPVSRRTTRGRDGLEITLGEVALVLADRTTLRCVVRNRGTTPVVVATAELSGAVRRRATINTVVTAGGEVSLALGFDGVPAPGSEVRLLDAEGRELVTLKAFR